MPLVHDLVSPELVLVDPELADRARIALSDDALRRVAAAAARDVVAPAPVATVRRRLRTPARPVRTLLGIAVAALVITTFTGPQLAGDGTSTTSNESEHPATGTAKRPATADVRYFTSRAPFAPTSKPAPRPSKASSSDDGPGRGNDVIFSSVPPSPEVMQP